MCRYTLFQSRKTLYAPKFLGVLKKKKKKKQKNLYPGELLINRKYHLNPNVTNFLEPNVTNFLISFSSK